MLYDFRSNVYSQFGEDGMVETLFNLIGVKSKKCIEFGAWDGIYLSNTANLFTNHGWEAVLIECDREKFKELIKNVSCYKCSCICEAVGINDQSLENILTKNKVDFSEIDLLSIDIDGNDYYVFESLEKLKPRVVICEYNSTIPSSCDVFAPYKDSVQGVGFGASVGALNRIAKQKGYTLVGLTDVNAFFIRNDEILLVSDSLEVGLDRIKKDWHLTYVITDYNGNYLFITKKNDNLPFGIAKPLKLNLKGSFRDITSLFNFATSP